VYQEEAPPPGDTKMRSTQLRDETRFVRDMSLDFDSVEFADQDFTGPRKGYLEEYTIRKPPDRRKKTAPRGGREKRSTPVRDEAGVRGTSMDSRAASNASDDDGNTGEWSGIVQL